MSNKMFNNFKKLLIIATVPIFAACEKFIQTDIPPTQIETSKVFNDDQAAQSAVRGIYSTMAFSTSFASGGISSVSILAGRSADDFENYSSGLPAEFSLNQLTQANTTLASGLWNEPFKYIYYANAVLEGLAASSNVTEPMKKQLTGEAKFVRAFCNFYLTNLFGKIPIITTTDFEVNRHASRKESSEAYDLIVSDLTSAAELLSNDYGYANGERIRPNKWAAKALLARVNLFLGNWAKAESFASEVIDDAGIYSIVNDLSHVFLKNSQEAIWQIMPFEGTINTRDGSALILTSRPSTISLSNALYATFSDNDLRKTNWVGSITSSGVTYYFPFKYKIKSGAPLTEYSMVLRLAEQYLIRAEARARQNNLSDAVGDIDVIRSRAGLTSLASDDPGISQENLLSEIQLQRRLEFFSEWGHRWLDIKRTKMADAVIGVLKPETWQSTDTLYPIPIAEINNNANLLPQNNGYNQ